MLGPKVPGAGALRAIPDGAGPVRMRSMSAPETTTVFLLDDHEVVRRGLRELLEADGDIEVVGESGSAAEATRAIPALRPDVAVLDGRLPDGVGDRRLPRRPLGRPGDPGADPHVVRRRRGAVRGDHGRRGRLRAQAGPAATTSSTRSAASPPGSRCSTRPSPRGSSTGCATAPSRPRRARALTAQERKILGLIAEGLTNRQIGERMFLAEKTVKNYVSSVLRQARPGAADPGRGAGHPAVGD